MVREPWAGDPGEMSQEHSGNLCCLSEIFLFVKIIVIIESPTVLRALVSCFLYFHLLNKYLLSVYYGTIAVRYGEYNRYGLKHVVPALLEFKDRLSSELGIG